MSFKKIFTKESLFDVLREYQKAKYKGFIARY